MWYVLRGMPRMQGDVFPEPAHDVGIRWSLTSSSARDTAEMCVL